MPVCPSCGQDNPASARFCMSCAAPLAIEEPAPHGARKTVTVVFCDVAGSTPLGERLDPESVREVMTVFFREMRAAQARREALDGLNPDLLRRFEIQLQTRIGVNTGEVVVGDAAAGQALVVGDAVNVAARLEQGAEGGGGLLRAGTYALVRDFV